MQTTQGASNRAAVDPPGGVSAPPAPSAVDAGLAFAELLFSSAAAGVCIIDRELRYVRVNDVLAAMNGRAAAAHIGLSIYDVIPDAAPTLAPLARRILESGEAMLDVPSEVEHPAGVLRRLTMSYYPVRDTLGAVTGLVAVAVEREPGAASERSAVRVAAREADRARVLRTVMTRMREATSVPQVASAVVEDALPALGADAGYLGSIVYDAAGRASAYEVVRITGFDEETTARFSSAPIVRGRPISEVALTGTAIFVESSEECRLRYPAVFEDFTGRGFRSFAATPAKVGDRVVAVLSFSFREERHFDSATRDFLATLTEQCALALERVRLHEAERHAAERQAAILATVQDAFAALDRELRFTYVNTFAEQLLHKRADELLGRRLGDVFPQAVGKDVEQAMRRVLATGERQQAEVYSPVVGSWIEVRLYPAPDGLSIVFQDVSARRRRQDASAFLADASRQLASSLDYQQTIRAVTAAAVPTLGDWCAVCLIDDPEAEQWPPHVETIAVEAQDPETLRHASELAKRYPIDWSSTRGVAAVLRTAQPELIPSVTDAMLKSIARDEEHLVMLRALHCTSSIIVPLVARGVTLGALMLFITRPGRAYDADDLALAQDLAQRQAFAVDNARLLHQARRAKAEAEAANRAKTEFLAVMSYELRTPLNAIGGYVRILDLELHGPVTEQQRTALERIRRSQMHLAEIINQVLNFARLESGTVTYELRPLRLGEVVADILPRIESQRAAKRLALQVRMLAPMSDGESFVMADPDKLQQVLLNMLSNAVKFTTTGGHVTVEVVPDDESGTTLLHVTDTGIGIPPSKLEAIFEPFVQVDRSLNNPGEGTGLGLPISRVLARGMGGDLTAVSTPGRGSTFTLRLRRA